jgi:CHAT domain-containing protein/tetratricopeptide (TPR) repeat protein
MDQSYETILSAVLNMISTYITSADRNNPNMWKRQEIWTQQNQAFLKTLTAFQILVAEFSQEINFNDFLSKEYATVLLKVMIDAQRHLYASSHANIDEIDTQIINNFANNLPQILHDPQIFIAGIARLQDRHEDVTSWEKVSASLKDQRFVEVKHQFSLKLIVNRIGHIMTPQEIYDYIDNTLSQWLNTRNSKEQRAFLEQHVELLYIYPDDPYTPQEVAKPYAEQPMLLNIVLTGCALLRDARERGGTIEAIQEAYINFYRGFVLDIPLWLQEINDQCEILQSQGAPQSTAQERANLWRQALQLAQQDTTLIPETIAEIRFQLWNALDDLDVIANEKMQEELLSLLEQMLLVYTQERYPFAWAFVQHHLGFTYARIFNNNKEKSYIAHALLHYKNALEVRSPDTVLADWALTQTSMADAYKELSSDNAENQEYAIVAYNAALQYFTSEISPSRWAAIQSNLVDLYNMRLQGDKRENAEAVIVHLTKALSYYNYDDFPAEWAMMQMELARKYLHRQKENRRDNIERAINIFNQILPYYTRDKFPSEWAEIQLGLAFAHMERSGGDRSDNVESSIAFAIDAMQVYTENTFPEEWAIAQVLLGNAFSYRYKGYSLENIEKAVQYYHNALKIYTKDNYLDGQLDVLVGLGHVYTIRLTGSKKENIEKAIKYCNDIFLLLEERNLNKEEYIEAWGVAQVHLGNAYRERKTGNRKENLEQAIACYKASANVRNQENFPIKWALAQYNIGNIYKDLGNYEEAIAHYKRALTVRTSEVFPLEYRQTWVAIAKTEAIRSNWEAVHTAYTFSYTVEDVLLALASDPHSHDTVVKEGEDSGVIDCLALIHLGRLEEAIITVESSRTRAFAENQLLAAADPHRIQNLERRQRYRDTCQALIAARNHLSIPPSIKLKSSEEEQRQFVLLRNNEYRRIKEEFDQIIAGIREAQDPPDFLQINSTIDVIWDALEVGEMEYAIVYLFSTPWGGMALGAFKEENKSNYIEALNIPNLKNSFVQDLIAPDPHDLDERVSHGFMLAQVGAGLRPLDHRPGKTLLERAANLHKEVMEKAKVSIFDVTLQELLNDPNPELQGIAVKPWSELSERDFSFLANVFNRVYLQCELRYCSAQLRETVLSPLATWLKGKTIKRITLIPCGALNTFPLLNIPINDVKDPTAWETLSDIFTASVVPSARSLTANKPLSTRRAGVYAMGDPRPTHQSLDWGEAEAHTLTSLAGQHDRNHVRVHYQATRAWLLDALSKAYVMDISSHAVFNSDDFLRSSLKCAKGETLTLGEALSGIADLHGLRLLILSACETAILDLVGAADEVRSLTTGMIQAGARAVLGSLWSVDDKATYLLIVRFAQEWFPNMSKEPPAAALARAQRWLRRATNRDLLAWSATNHLAPTLEDQKRLVLTPDRGNRYEMNDAETFLKSVVREHTDPDDRPYADPYYWAGFQVSGW